METKVTFTSLKRGRYRCNQTGEITKNPKRIRRMLEKSTRLGQGTPDFDFDKWIFYWKEDQGIIIDKARRERMMERRAQGYPSGLW